MTPKTAVITGGSRGIGAAAARALAHAGWDIVINFRSQQDQANQVVADCLQLGVRAIAIAGDVSATDDVDRLFAAADELGPVTAVINNAGVLTSPARVEAMDAARINQLFATNVTGAFMVAGRAVRRMSVSAGGSGGVIINLSSRAAVLGAPGENVDYAASKAAIDALTVGLGREVAEEGIRVVGIRPGLIETDMQPAGRLDRIGTTPPLGRPGTAEEVAAVIAFLVSPAASYVTGTTIDVSGGR